MQKLLLVAVVVGAAPWLSGQAANLRSQSSPHDLNAQMKVFESYSKDFRAMQQPSHGEELEVLLFLDQVATIAEERLYAANAALHMYDGISCNPDRLKAKGILKEQLEYYSWAFDSEVTRTTGSLTFVKVPAAAQAGLRMKDDLRATKEKLDSIAASLR